MTYAAAADVASRWGKDLASFDTATTALIEARLADVERLIRRRLAAAVPTRDLDAEITDSVLDVDDVIQVEADAVIRLARNPDGYQSESDGSYTYMLTANADNNVLEILPTEWQTLGLLNTGMFIIVPTPVLAT